MGPQAPVSLPHHQASLGFRPGGVGRRRAIRLLLRVRALRAALHGAPTIEFLPAVERLRMPRVAVGRLLLGRPRKRKFCTSQPQIVCQAVHKKYQYLCMVGGAAANHLTGGQDTLRELPWTEKL